MRNKGPLSKRKVLSVRITDSEMGQIQEMMEATQLSASELLREALLTFTRRTRWEGGSRAGAARAA